MTVNQLKRAHAELIKSQVEKSNPEMKRLCLWMAMGRKMKCHWQTAYRWLKIDESMN